MDQCPNNFQHSQPCVLQSVLKNFWRWNFYLTALSTFIIKVTVRQDHHQVGEPLKVNKASDQGDQSDDQAEHQLLACKHVHCPDETHALFVSLIKHDNRFNSWHNIIEWLFGTSIANWKRESHFSPRNQMPSLPQLVGCKRWIAFGSWITESFPASLALMMI